MVPQALHDSAASCKMKEKIQDQEFSSCDADRKPRSNTFHASAMSGYPRYPTALNSTSKRVRVNARVSNHPTDIVTIGTATDVCQHRTDTSHNENTEKIVVPPGVINSSADGSSLQSLPYVRFHLSLGDISLPVEALVLPALAPNSILLDITIMNAVRGVPDCRSEHL